MRSPLSRRTILLSGVAAAGLGSLSACGLRWDTEPELPTLGFSDELRNRIAGILKATAPGPDDPETATADLEKIRAAIGPPWSPPTELATASPVSEPQRTYLEAAEVVSTSVFEALGRLGSGLVTVLVDSAIGFALTAGTRNPSLIESAQDRLTSALDAADPENPAAPAAELSGAILDQARAAAYGYERLAVKFAEGSPERGAAVARLETLGSLAGQMLEMLAATDTDPPPDSPSWELDPVPDDEGSARELALGLEDAVASTLQPWLRTDPLAAGRLWESARTRSVFGAAQALRYSYADDATSTEGATDTAASASTTSATSSALGAGPEGS